MTLARALYSKASILLLDDVLAALDVHTARRIVEKALKGDLIKDRTVILVTHNIALTAPIADNVTVLGRGGTVTAHGTVADILKSDSRLRRQAEVEDYSTTSIVEDVETGENKGELSGEIDTNKQSNGKLIVAEEKAIGRVKWASLKIFVDGVGGPWIWLAIFLTYFLCQVTYVYQNAVMGYWTSQYDIHRPSEVPTLLCVVFQFPTSVTQLTPIIPISYLALYSSGSVLQLLANMLCSFLWTYRTLRASRIIHKQLMHSLFSATFR